MKRQRKCANPSCDRTAHVGLHKLVDHVPGIQERAKGFCCVGCYYASCAGPTVTGHGFGCSYIQFVAPLPKSKKVRLAPVESMPLSTTHATLSGATVPAAADTKIGLEQLNSLENQVETNLNTLRTLGRARMERLSSTHGPVRALAINSNPVYLGTLYHSTREIKSGAMLRRIYEDAKTWTDIEFSGRYSALCPFFEKIPDGTGYRKKSLVSIHVDHVVPSDLGGIDHPRNYCLMAGELNSSFGNRDWAEKIALLGQPHVRAVFQFMRAYRDAVAPARGSWIASLSAPMGTRILL